MNLQKQIHKFREQFPGNKKLYLSSAPGRVNLIGEHTNYNEGFVMPIAMEHRTQIIFSPNDSGTVNLYSGNYDRIQRTHHQLIMQARKSFAVHAVCAWFVSGLQRKAFRAVCLRLAGLASRRLTCSDGNAQLRVLKKHILAPAVI